MGRQETAEIEGAYCGEPIRLMIDGSFDSRDYVDDGQVCCRPMNIPVTVNEQGLSQVEAHREDE